MGVKGSEPVDEAEAIRLFKAGDLGLVAESLTGRSQGRLTIGQVSERLQGIAQQKAAVSARLETLNQRWKQERELVMSIREIRSKLENGQAQTADTNVQSSQETPT